MNDTQGKIWIKYILAITALMLEVIALAEYGEWFIIMLNSKSLDNGLSSLTELMVCIEKSLILVTSSYAHFTTAEYFKAPHD